MRQPKWTPGPWTAESVFGLFYRIYASGPAGQVNVARTLARPPFMVRSDNQVLYPTDTETEANAHLMASAPLLHEALYQTQQILGNSPHRDAYGIIEGRLEKNAMILAKARGESQ